jgi:hypothetical protein
MVGSDVPAPACLVDPTDILGAHRVLRELRLELARGRLSLVELLRLDQPEHALRQLLVFLVTRSRGMRSRSLGFRPLTRGVNSPPFLLLEPLKTTTLELLAAPAGAESLRPTLDIRFAPVSRSYPIHSEAALIGNARRQRKGLAGGARSRRLSQSRRCGWWIKAPPPSGSAPGRR